MDCRSGRERAREPDDDNHAWSFVGSPPFTDDARRGRPAVQDHNMQGDLPKAKPVFDAPETGLHIHALGRPTMPEGNAVSRADAAEFASRYLPDVVEKACRNFKLFHKLDPKVASAEMVDAQSSLKVSGWASAYVADWSAINSECRSHKDYVDEQSRRRTHSCYVCGNADTVSGAGLASEEHNEQVAQLINGMGESRAGRRAIFRAITVRQGFSDEDEIADILPRADQPHDDA